MSAGNAVSVARSAPAEQAPAPAPLIGDTGSPGLDAVADVVNSTAQPFQNLTDPSLGTAAKVENGLNAVTGVMGVVPDLIDTGFAVLTAPLAALFPALPAITLLGMHVGPPHTHTHPPSFIPPAPPVPLPSLGVLLGAGAVTVMLGGIPAARCGDIGISVTCGSLAPPFEVFTGSSNVFIGGARAARMGDITKHCDPTSGGMPGAMDLIMNAMAFAAGGLAGNPGAMAQAAAETAVLALKAIMGKDPGLPMLPGVLVGPPVPNVLIGGFPCPALGDMAAGALMGGLKKMLGKGLAKLKGKQGGGGPSKAGEAPPRKHDNASDSDSAAQKEANGKACEGTEPVYLVTGENHDSYVDFVSGGLFEWRRHYTSARCRQDGPLGYGWRHFFQRSLRRRLHRATFIDWDGLRTEFDRFERGENTTRSNGYVLERLGREAYRVKYRGRPALEFQGGEFETELRLHKVIGAEGELELSYDRLGRLSSLIETSPRAWRRFDLRLDERGRIREVWEVDAGGGARPSLSRPLLRASYAYTPGGDLELVKNALEGQSTYAYDSFHRITRLSDARGYAYTYRYDASGRCVEATGQDGLWASRMEYHPERGLTLYTEGGGTWEYHYDPSGVVTKIIDPYGGERTRSIDDQGRMALEVDAGGRALHWLYDADGAHYARVDRFGHLLPPERDQPRPPNPFAHALPSNSFGWLLAGVHPPRPESMFGVDAAELAAFPPELQRYARGCFRFRQGERDPQISPAVPHAELDALGRKVRELDALGRKREWRYDATGNLIASIDRDGRKSTRETTSWNLLGTRADALGNGVQYQYDSVEQIVQITDPLGNESRYDYDLKQRLVRVFRHGVLREEYVYDEGDHFVEKRDGRGNVLFSNSVHPNQFVERRSLASGGFHLYDYDHKGRVILASTEAHEVQLAYGTSGRRLRDVCDGQGVEHAHVTLRGATRTTLLGRFEHAVRPEAGAVQISHSGGGTTRIELTSGGLLYRRCANGSVEVLQFDDAGQLEASLRYKNGRFGLLDAAAVRYTYSGEGDLLQIADSERGTTQYEVDAAHRLTRELTPDGRDLFYVQDAAGNVVSRPGASRIEVGPGNLLRATPRESFAYDERNHLCERTLFVGPTREPATTRYHYDSFDMLVAIERERPQLPAWLLRIEDPSVPAAPVAPDPERDWHVWRAEYDALGRRVSTRWSAPELPERTRRFYWDGDRLAAEVFPDGILRVYEYATFEALVPLAFTDYPSTEAAPETGRTHHVFVNPVGLPLCIEDEHGKIVWWAERVDPYGAIEVRADSTLEYNLRWPGHYHDPETGLHYNRHRYYDPQLCRYLQSDPTGYAGSPINLYAYCPNPLVQVDVLGLDHKDKIPANASDNPTKKKGAEDTKAEDGVEAPPARKPLQIDRNSKPANPIPEGGRPVPPGTPLPNGAKRPENYFIDQNGVPRRRPDRPDTSDPRPASEWDPPPKDHPNAEAIDKSRQKQVEATEANKGKDGCAAVAGDTKTHSGYETPKDGGFEPNSRDAVHQRGDETGHDFADGGARDHDHPGEFNSSHAEKQATVAQPGEPVGVDKPMCRDCRNFFRQEANAAHQDKVVTDPDMTRVFHPDGSVTEIYPNGQTGSIAPTDPY